MHKTTILLFHVMLCALNVTAGEAAQEEAKHEHTLKPNLLLIYCDDLGWGDVSFNGHPIVKTPNIDALAAEGMIFDHNYAGAPHCSPSRVALMLGKASYRVGFYDIVGRGDMKLPEKETTIAELLRDDGYSTFHGGKWHMDPSNTDPQVATKRHGFDESVDSGMATNVVADFSKWLKPADTAAKPFFAYLAFHESHMPVEKYAPESFRQKFRPVDEDAFKTIRYGGDRVERNKAKRATREVYYGCVAQLDSAMGDLVRLLKERGLFDNTLIYFSSDNGPEHRNSYSWGTPGDYRGAKGHIHEGGIRVPGFAVWPGKIKPRQRSETPIHAWDVLPTFAEAATAKLTVECDGQSFLPVTRGETLHRRTPLYWSWYNARGGVNYAIRVGNWKLLAIAEPRPSGRKVVEHIKQAGFSGYELYDLKSDPNENNDLAESRPDELERMKELFLPLHKDIVSNGPMLNMNGDKASRKTRG
ncbi:Arylsulfatase [Planctomycetes bacterium CA13]|uniref:Arylsulfatase n=1 Tax=Novipirellula herctigrandis TaxID=2527986 RepID=A0A5C5Z3B5_9BACT|nr:Arylsulfatase [Planctomycetes bacterium CA13]